MSTQIVLGKEYFDDVKPPKTAKFRLLYHGIVRFYETKGQAERGRANLCMAYRGEARIEEIAPNVTQVARKAAKKKVTEDRLPALNAALDKLRVEEPEQ